MSNFNDFTAHGYEVIKELGSNCNAGRVAYLARQTDADRLVVIKQFQFTRTGANWDGHKPIEREVEILKQLKHPYIPRYLSRFETEHSSCIVQEYIDGRPLSEIISNQQLYTQEQVKEIILKLLEVLVYLQTEFTDPVLHRDIKPANILIDNSCQPYLIDFGGAKVSEGKGGSTVAIGTLGFMPPELRFQQFDKTTDIYSLGMSIVCWLTRTEPTEMYNIINMGTNQVMGLRELLSAYSLRFVDWLEKVVQPDPKDRYPDAEAAFNAFKPLYVKRVPEAILSSSALEFKAMRLGKRMTQTLMVRNKVPETILEGWWEVVPHPSDPPHPPNSHAWISFGSRKFSGNDNKCQIVVNTDKLMAGKVYKRQLLLHSNSLKLTQEVELNFKTARIPIEIEKSYYVNLMLLMLTTGGITSFLAIHLTAFVAILTVIPGLIIYGIGLFIIITIIILFLSNFDLGEESGCTGAGCGTLIILGIAQYIAQLIYGFIPQIFEFSSLSIYKNAIFPLMICILLCYVFFWIIFTITNDREWSDKTFSLKTSVALSIICGILIPILLFTRYQGTLLLIATLSMLFLFTSTLLHSIIIYRKLVSKYRDSEKGLIKP
jgi:serine/threonine protein kinase